MKDSPVDSVATPKVAIDWYRTAPWWRFASQSIVISWRATHLLLCAAGLLLTQLWTATAHEIFGPDSEMFPNWVSPTASTQPWPGAFAGGGTELPISIWQRFADPVFQWLAHPTLTGAAYCLASMIGIIAIWTFIGGCLTRRSAVELGTRMTAPWAESIRLVLKRWQSIAWSLTMPSGLILMIALAPLALGWLSNIAWVGPWLAGLLMVPVLFFSLGIGWCAAITLFGFPLSVCAIVTEKGADAYDGISRSAAYTFQRPLTLALCLLSAQFLSSIGGMFLNVVISTGSLVISAAFDIGSYSSLQNYETMWGPTLRGIVPLLLASYGFSFFWTASAATYLILRRDVDHAEFDLIDMVVEEAKPLPELPKREPTIQSGEPASGGTAIASLPENTAE